MTHGGSRDGSGRKTKSPSEKKQTVSFSMSPVWISHLEMFAERNGISKSEAIEVAFQDMLIDDDYRAKFGSMKEQKGWQ